MRRRAVVLALAALSAGCGIGGREAPEAPDAPATGAVVPLRDPGAPVAAQVDVTPERLAGDWRVVAGRGVPPGARVRFAPGRVEIAGAAQPLEVRGPGRFSVGGRDLWVHWLDADARTAAMGDPGGGWVFVIDRAGAPGERMAAARTVLDWYGYDAAALR